MHNVPLPLAILIPARNEAARLPAVLESVLPEPAAEIWVINDDSQDATPELARRFQARDARVRLLTLTGTDPDWTGKNRALRAGALATTQPWLLLLDADVTLLPGCLATVWRRLGAGLPAPRLEALSLSPEQVLGSWAERLFQPAIFAELELAFPIARVNHPGDPCAAANGQFICMRRELYLDIGTAQPAWRRQVLEDVALAVWLKQTRRRYAFYSGQGLARARMYTGLGSLWRGWRKNLYWLLPARRMLLAAVAGLLGLAALGLLASKHMDLALAGGAAAAALWLFLISAWPRVSGADHRLTETAPAAPPRVARGLGLLLLPWLYFASAWQVRVRRRVAWKGRTLPVTAPLAGKWENMGMEQLSGE